MAIWSMETDNGTGDMGKLPVIRTLATLAHDCRRTDLFQRELIASLRIVQRGDLPLRDLIGAYYMAGAGGQTTIIVPSHDLVMVRMGHYRGETLATAAFRKALALLMEALPTRN